MVATSSVNLLFKHTGLLEVAVAVGNGFITTDVVAIAVHPLASFTVTVYVPELAVVACEILGSLTVEPENEPFAAHE